MTVKLQGIYNKQEAKAVKELKTGDVIMWNYGYVSTVVGLIPSKTGKIFTCLLKSNQDALSVKEKWVQKDWLLSHSSQPERMVNDYENRYCCL